MVLFVILYITKYKATPDNDMTTMQGYTKRVRPDLRILAVFALVALIITAIFWFLFHLPVVTIVVATLISTLLATVLFHIYMEKNQLYSITQRQIYFEKLFNRYIGEPTFKGVVFATLTFLKQKIVLILWMLALFVFMLILVKNKLLAMHFTTILCVVELVVLMRVKSPSQNSAKRGLIFAKTLTSLTLLAIFIGSIPTLASFFDAEKTNKLLLNIVAFIDNTITPLSTFAMAGNFLAVILPVPMFFAIYYIARALQSASSRVQKWLLKRLPVSDTSTAVFHDNLSLYPVLLHSLVLVAVLYLLHTQLAFITTLISTLIGTLQVSEVFKIDWLSEKNISLFFNAIFYIAVVYSAYKLIAKLYTSLFSSLILYDDQLVFVQSTLSQKKIVQLPTSGIKSVTFRQTPLEKLVDIGTLIVGTDDDTTTIKAITSIHQRNEQIAKSAK